MKNLKVKAKPVAEWLKTAVILLTVGFVGGYFYASHMNEQNQAKLLNAVKTVQVIKSASK